jgi:hypothetical protein
MKFLYYLAAFGSPFIESKFFYLKNNLNYLYKNLNTSFDIIVNNYNIENESIILQFLNSFSFLEKKYVFSKTGHLTELFLNNPYNSIIPTYDYILFILDDVSDFNLNIHDFISFKNKYQLQMCSPKVFNATYSYMYQLNENTKLNFLEIFCFLLNPKDFELLMSLMTKENKYMWGTDLLFGHLKISAGIISKFSVKHMILNKEFTNSEDKFKKCNEYLNKFHFKNLEDIRKKYNPIICNL